MDSLWYPKPLHRLAGLSESDAVRSYFDGLNARTLFRFLAGFGTLALFASLIAVAEGWYRILGIAAPTLILCVGLYRICQKLTRPRPFRSLLLAYLTLQFLLLRALYMGSEPRFEVWDFLVPALLWVFRLPLHLAALPAGVFWLASTGYHLSTSWISSSPLDLPLATLQTVITLGVLVVSGNLHRRELQGFLARWRRENRSLKERQHLHEEMDRAREIQRSMLPRADPELEWLDLAGLCITADRVGGDYFDYLKVAKDRQAVVIGDVAGHGLASGLLLSGIRSCLYLLQPTPLEPQEILQKLDRMLRQTTGKRVFVTMAYGIFDRGTRSLTLASAGQPPLMLFRPTNRAVEEIPLHALPLGTSLGTQPQQTRLDYRPGDIFLFYSDGLTEIADAKGEVFGTDRLAESLRKAASDGGRGSSAKAIRRRLLEDVQGFKGDNKLHDDMTLVVAQIPA